MKENRSIEQILIVGSGEDFKAEKIKAVCADVQLVIAGDGGADILADVGIVPDILIGDMDSISPKSTDVVRGNCEVFKYPREKDYSDSQLCIKKALEYNPRKIILAAVTGTYIDHSIANLINLFQVCKCGTEIEIMTSNSRIFVITPNKPAEIVGKNGRRFSFFPIEPIEGLVMNGFYYHFSGDSLNRWEYSLSNVINNDNALLAFKSGKGIGILFDEDFS
ncbi:MAG: thiamine diphosphokinase [Spirochaetales bacterium]|nr:thiamine diphosphokinase [Spirochaetales bacterium]